MPEPYPRYINSVPYPCGSIGCVSNNYDDRKWLIVCDSRRDNLGEPGNFTLKSREEAAKAEQALEVQAKRTSVPVTSRYFFPVTDIPGVQLGV